MTGFTPGLFDRLLAEHGGANTRLNLEQLKDAVARDLEDLLNTRTAFPEELLDCYPECRGSILTYGLMDFAGMCLSSSTDRDRVCASLKTAIERHEPRLRDVEARLEREPGAINRVSFVINARLALPQQEEVVSFDAVLQPSTLHYSINRTARGATP